MSPTKKHLLYDTLDGRSFCARCGDENPRGACRGKKKPRTQSPAGNRALAESRIAAGEHPLQRGPLRQPVGEETCGSCANMRRVGHRAKKYKKCVVVGDSHSEATDLALWWPACSKWQPAGEEGDGR